MALSRNDLAAAQARLESCLRLQPRTPACGWHWRRLTGSSMNERIVTAARKAEGWRRRARCSPRLASHYSKTENFSTAAEMEARYAETSADAYPAAVELPARPRKPKAAIHLASEGIGGARSGRLHDLLGKACDADGIRRQR